MLKVFKPVAPLVKFDPKRVTIDNFVFKLHYRLTFIILIVATVLVCSRQYVGEHIKCISDTIPAKVIDTYCFFTPTFTLVRHLNMTALSTGAIFQPGIGPYETQEEPIKRHAYYQWVPFVLFGQALCFFLPHFLWKSWEDQIIPLILRVVTSSRRQKILAWTAISTFYRPKGGRIKDLVFGLKMVGISKYLQTQSITIGKLNLPSMAEMDSRIKSIRRTMIDRMRLNQSWGAHLIFAEILNLLNLLLQIYFTNLFLRGEFYGLGLKVLNERWTEHMDALDVVFPKVTKCHFRKFGPAGSLQMHDTLCVMALNIINEKIYTILWFWYVLLFVVTVLGLIWRAFTLFYYKSLKFTRFALYMSKPVHLDDNELSAVIRKCNFSNWMFLFFLRSNLSEFLFKKVIYHLASEFPEERSDNNANEVLLGDKIPSRLYPSNLETMTIDEVDTSLKRKPIVGEKLE